MTRFRFIPLAAALFRGQKIERLQHRPVDALRIA